MPRAQRTAIAALLVVIGLLAGPVATSAASSARVDGAFRGGVIPGSSVTPAGDALVWAWVIDTKPTTPSYTPDAKHQSSSAGDAHGTITRSSRGYYVVEFVDFTQQNGPVHVTPLSTSGLVMCDVDWLNNVAGGDVGDFHAYTDIYLHCFNDAGRPTDTPYVVDFLAQGTSNAAAVAYELEETAVSSGTDTPPDYDQHNFKGYTDTVVRLAGVGQYEAVFPGLFSSVGGVQVTAYGDKAVCAIDHSYIHLSHSQIASLHVLIQCRAPNGAALDSGFSVSFTSQTGLKGTADGHQAYLFADQPSAASYSSDVDSFSTTGLSAAITRASAGAYAVSLPRLGLYGAIQVTAVGGQASGPTLDVRCLIRSIQDRPGTPPRNASEKIGVNCYDRSGHAVDSEFTLDYAR